ncbi:unnamed protein product [Ectocarpus sp. CCAP 1310/34]|nr:unnamed protein product [Ectocarpus sp. CCAP 1310/34]
MSIAMVVDDVHSESSSADMWSSERQHQRQTAATAAGEQPETAPGETAPGEVAEETDAVLEVLLSKEDVHAEIFAFTGGQPQPY